MIFWYINICWVPREVLKPGPEIVTKSHVEQMCFGIYYLLSEIFNQYAPVTCKCRVLTSPPPLQCLETAGPFKRQAECIHLPAGIWAGLMTGIKLNWHSTELTQHFSGALHRENLIPPLVPGSCGTVVTNDGCIMIRAPQYLFHVFEAVSKL